MPTASVGELQSLAEEKLTALGGQLDQAQRALESKQKEVTALDASRTALQQQVDGLAQEVTDTKGQLLTLKGKLSSAHAAIAQRLQDQEAAAHKAVAELEKKLNQLGKERGEVTALRTQAKAILDETVVALQRANAEHGTQTAQRVKDAQALQALLS